MRVVTRLQWAPDFQRRNGQAFSRAQAYVDSQCIRRMRPETPRLTGRLQNAPQAVTPGCIAQSTPYARRQYYEHRSRSRWFERMKNRHKDSILQGALQAYGHR